MAARQQRDIVPRLFEILNTYPDAEFGYYGIAHIPLLFHIGSQIQTRMPLHLFEHNRDQWVQLLHREGDYPQIALEGLPDAVIQTGGDVIVRISISYLVSLEVIEGIVSNPIASLHLSLDHPKRDIVTSKDQLEQYSIAFREMLDDINHKLPNAGCVHIFYAGPVALAVNFGRQISKTIHPRIIVYNYSSKDNPPGYAWGLDVTADVDSSDFMVKSRRFAINMFSLHDTLNQFYSDYVRLDADERNKLAGYRDINLERLKSGLDKLGEEHDATYAYYQYYRNQGSYATFTLNQHPDNEYDIDVAIVFKKYDLPSSALKARQIIADAFKKVAGNFSQDPEARANAVTVWYAEGYHIDFAVYRTYEDMFGNTIIEHAGPEWTERDPMDLTNWFNDAVNQSSPLKEYGATVEKYQMRRIVQMLKVFAKSRSSWNLPGGLIISVLVAHCYQPDYDRDDVALYNTMVAIHNRLLLSNQVWSPVNPPELLTNKEEYKKQVERFRDQLDIAITKLAPVFKDDCTKDEAMSTWNWMFNHPFWAEADEDRSETEDHSGINERELVLSDTAKPALGRTSHQQPIPWRFVRKHRVRLYAYVYLNKQVKLGGLKSDGRTIRNGLDLKFEVKTNLRGTYQVFWQVVNTGRHAESAGGGRGDVFELNNSNPSVHWEKSLYTGKHWIECFIVKDGVCVARSGGVLYQYL